jgi:LuxR family transcriptional regulator/LuxR family quorum-sensing system transcriptional regulator CciR
MDIESFEKRIAEVQEPAALWDLVTEYFETTDVARMIYHHLPPLGAPDGNRVDVAAHGVPDDLVSRYVEERLYLSNPMLRHALQSVEPFYFDEIAARNDLDASERAFIEDVRALGLLNGLGVQVFGPNGRNGYCGLGLRPGVTRIDPSELRNFQWVCQLAHLRYCGMLQSALGPTPSLSEREAEVLSWVARGKSNTSIAEILGISVHTVDAHLRRIYLKLGVYDRISAAVRGIGTGLIPCELPDVT